MKRILFALILAGTFAAHSSANAQGTYPNRPLRIVVPTPPGGYLDPVSREIAQPLSAQIAQPVVIQNLPGRNGQVAMEFVGGSPADGYTILMFSSKMPLPPGMFKPVLPVASMVNGNDWYGMLLPAATPQEVVIKLNAAVNRVLGQPEMASKLAAMGSLRPAGGTPENLADLIATGVGSDGTTAATAGNADRTRQNIAAAERQPVQAEKPADSGSGFFGALLGGLASKYVDRTAAQINSAAAGTSGVGGVAMGALGGVSTQLARETKEQIAKDMGDNGSAAGMAGALVGNVVGSGSRAGAMAALSGATNNLTGSALSGSTGSGASTGGSTSGSGCCSSASERIADNKARGAPDNFETNNERICREGKSRAYCEAGVTERRLNLGGLERFGRPGSGSTVASASSKATAAQEQACQKGYLGRDDDPQFDWACKNAHFNKCLDETTKIPTYRVQTRTVCMQLDQTLRALNSGTAASYCPLYCGRQ